MFKPLQEKSFFKFFYSSFVRAKGLIVPVFELTLCQGVPRCFNRGVVYKRPEPYDIVIA